MQERPGMRQRRAWRQKPKQETPCTDYKSSPFKRPPRGYTFSCFGGSWSDSGQTLVTKKEHLLFLLPSFYPDPSFPPFPLILRLAEEAEADTDSTESPERTKTKMFKMRFCLLGKKLSKNLHLGGGDSKSWRQLCLGYFKNFHHKYLFSSSYMIFKNPPKPMNIDDCSLHS